MLTKVVFDSALWRCNTGVFYGVEYFPSSGGSPPPTGGGSPPPTGGTPPPPPTTFSFTITGTCRAGCGLWMFSGPDYHTATTRQLPDGTVLQIVCQTSGATLSEAGYTSAIWDKTTQGDWASDLYLNTPVYANFSPGIPRC